VFRRAGMPIKDVPLCDETMPLDARSAPKPTEQAHAASTRTPSPERLIHHNSLLQAQL